MLANKHRGEIALPEAGEGAFLRFTVDSLERLESEYGPDYMDIVLKGMTQVRPKVFKSLILVSINNTKDIDLPWSLSFEQLQARILDALYVTIHGRTFAEQQKHEDELFQQRLEEAQKNPRMAAALYSKLAEKQDTDQA